MPKVKKKQGALELTYSDILGLSNVQLNNKCKQYGINIKYGKKAKINLLCSKAGISTTGAPVNVVPQPHLANSFSSAQLAEFATLTPGYLATLDGWTKDLTLIPDLHDGTVKQYLCRTHTIPADESRRYKLSRPFQLKEFIHSMKLHPQPVPSTNTFIVIEAQCNPSQSTSSDDVKVLYIVTDAITGHPYVKAERRVFCQSCGHIGAALFCITDLVASGCTTLPADPSCTDTLCQWTNPKAAAVTPKLLDDIVVKKQKPVPSERRTLDVYGSAVLGRNNMSKPTHQQIMKLRNGLFMATQHLGYHVPAVHVLTPSNFSKEYNACPTAGVSSIPDVVNECDAVLAPARVVTITSKPIPIAFRPATANVDSFLACLKCTADERMVIEASTRGQSTNVEWYQQRMGSMCGSMCGEVLRYQEGASISAERLVNQVMGYRCRDMVTPKLPNKPSLKWGHANETKARKMYEAKEVHHHIHLLVKESGLVVHPKKSYFRASPDGLVTCDCHDRRLLEIKCPWSARNSDVLTAIQEGKITYLVCEKNKLHLRRDHSNGYYAQVQMGMAVTGTQSCDFVVYTCVDFQIVHVLFDAEYWTMRLEPCMSKFFMNHVVPAILHDHIGREECVTTDTLDIMDYEVSDCNLVGVVRCGQCAKLLPDMADISPDNSDASIVCMCICNCNVWFCLECAHYDQEMIDEGDSWFCPQCIRKCDITY